MTFGVFTVFQELCEADFHKPGIYGSGRAWANAWGVFHHMPSRGGRGRWADVGFVVCFRWGDIFFAFFLRFFSFERTRFAASMRPFCLIYLSTINSTCNEAVFLPLGQKGLFIPGCVQGANVKLVCA